MKKVLVLISFFLLFCSPVFGAIYCVDGKKGLDTNIGTIEKPWKTIHKANTNAIAGDIVYIRGGTETYQVYEVGAYDGSTETRGIEPRNTGTPGNPITYSVYPGEKVHFQGNDDKAYTRGVYLNNKSYIKVTGVSGRNLKFSKMWKQLYIENDSHYNEISYCEFTEDGRYTWGASQIKNNVMYNHIHDCTFSKHGYLTAEPGGNEGGLFDLGRESYEDIQTYNVVEDCEFYHSGHHTFGFYGKYSVVRNNYFHNEEWYEYKGELYSYRNLMLSGKPDYTGYNLFEGNRIGYAGENVTVYNQGGGGMKVTTPYNLFRYNSWFANKGMSVYIQPAYGGVSSHNYFYNNIFYHNGYYSGDASFRHPFMFGCQIDEECWRKNYGNVIKNNTFYQNYTSAVWDANFYAALYPCTDDHVTSPDWGNTTIEKNWDDYNAEGDPKFANLSLDDPKSKTLPDFALQAGSCLIEQSNHLTQANGNGSSTKLIVDDARYFQDGNFGHGSLSWPDSVDIQADWIAIGSKDNIVQIASIDYDTNTITLVEAKAWNDEDPVWLYKKSDGEVVLSEVVLSKAAPDVEPHETIIPPPQNVRIAK
jgi:hypothetical protein